MHLISQIYFWNKTLHVSDSYSVHHQEFFTAHTAMVHVIQVCWQLASSIGTELQCIQWKTRDDGWRNCSKHVEFYSKNKFEKLVHLVGFIMRMLLSILRTTMFQNKGYWWIKSFQVGSLNHTTAVLKHLNTCKFLCPSSGVFHCTRNNGMSANQSVDIYHICVYSEKLLMMDSEEFVMMDRGTVRNM